MSRRRWISRLARAFDLEKRAEESCRPVVGDGITVVEGGNDDGPPREQDEGVAVADELRLPSVALVEVEAVGDLAVLERHASAFLAPLRIEERKIGYGNRFALNLREGPVGLLVFPLLVDVDESEVVTVGPQGDGVALSLIERNRPFGDDSAFELGLDQVADALRRRVAVDEVAVRRVEQDDRRLALLVVPFAGLRERKRRGEERGRGQGGRNEKFGHGHGISPSVWAATKSGRELLFILFIPPKSYINLL